VAPNFLMLGSSFYSCPMVNKQSSPYNPVRPIHQYVSTFSTTVKVPLVPDVNRRWMRLPAHMRMLCPMRPRWLAESLSCDLICPRNYVEMPGTVLVLHDQNGMGSGSDGKRAARGSRVERRRNAAIKPDGGHRPRAKHAILRFDFFLPHCAVT
jgi:hypothetical protein